MIILWLIENVVKMAIAGIIPIGMAIAAMIPHRYIYRRGDSRTAPTGIVDNNYNWVAIIGHNNSFIQ